MSRVPDELRWPAIRLIPVRGAAADAGASRFGGLPEVPAGFEWPRHKGRPMSEADLRALASFRLKFGLPDVPAGSERPRDADRPLDFLLQVDLRDLAGLRSNIDLPETGRLLFFYDAETQPWGIDSSDAGSARVFYFDNAHGLAQRQPPEGQPALRSAQVHFQQIVTEPSPTDWFSPWLEGLDLDADDEARISEAAGRREADGYWGHLGGHPHVIQNAMEAECEEVSSGFGPEDRDAPGAAEALREAERKARDWRLLLQLPSYEALGWEWGSGMGLLYFWIRKDDLARRDFSRVWLILQTT